MSIPASRIVTINPAAIGAGGSPLALNTLLIESGNRFIPGVIEFGSAAEVGEYFGLVSPEYKFAQRYFLGYDGATRQPSALYIVRNGDVSRPAFVIGASVRDMTLAQLNLINGTLAITINGDALSVTVDLTSAASFSDAAGIIDAALMIASDGDAGCQFNSNMQRFEIYTVTTGLTSTIEFPTAGVVSTGLKLTQETGAQAENGTPAMDAAELMAYARQRTENFGVFTHCAEQTDAVRKDFAAWNTLQDSRFAYIAQDSGSDALVPNNPASFGAWLAETEQNGTTPYYGTIEQVAALCGGIAAIDFKRTNGRRNIMFMRQAGMQATVTTESNYTALISNGYTFYAEFATANDQFRFVTNGAVSGPFKWLDNYVNQIYMNAQFQLAMMTMLVSYGAIPYNDTGKAYQRAAAMDPINEMLNFGGIVPLIDPNALSEQQKSIINAQAGYDIVPSLLSDGWAMDIKNADAQTRAARGSMPFSFWYTDGGSVQAVNMASINVQ